MFSGLLNKRKPRNIDALIIIQNLPDITAYFETVEIFLKISKNESSMVWTQISLLTVFYPILLPISDLLYGIWVLFSIFSSYIPIFALILRTFWIFSSLFYHIYPFSLLFRTFFGSFSFFFIIYVHFHSHTARLWIFKRSICCLYPK